ncbi:YopX family protein [Streptococcus sanguinis]|jgi:hypothetical protein|uniref:YopX family protein n=1 Tax=Streptococcus sanguinis TaxID=1305 RepID=UPI001374DA1B|nr:YopX family protein [Streptococcus sanguinis]KAF1308109.1 hypothetical protein I925_02850 [Streptococcus sanguinis OH0843]DAN39697.1 MAG TPA: YopX protein [Caudoviricetes sp.]
MIPKFRAWVKEDKEMWPIHAIVFDNKTVWVEEPDDENPSGCLDFDDVILMQSTGLKDKNGKEIFEGDVAYNGFRKTIVNYGKQAIEEEFGAIREYVGFNLTLACGYPEAVPMNYEIIGNIYENPELLE